MVNLLTLDSSVFIAAIRKKEIDHIKCKKLIESIANGDYKVVVPCIVLVEVVAAVRRRTGSKEFAKVVAEQMLNIPTITFFDLIKPRVKNACKIAVESKLRGMDAIIVQLAKEMNAVLVTLDEEIMKRADGFAKVGSLEDLV